MKRTRAQALLLLAILAFVLAGCGATSDDNSSAGSTAAAPAQEEKPPAASAATTISAGEVAAAKPGTPERSILEWWREVQANDPEEAVNLYVKPPALADLAGQFNLVSPHMGGAIEIVSVDEEGSPAVAKVRWKQPNGETRVVTLRLEQSGGAWKLVDTRFLDEMVVELQVANSGG